MNLPKTAFLFVILFAPFVLFSQGLKEVQQAIKGTWNTEADTSYHLRFSDSIVLELDGSDLTDSFTYYVKKRCCNKEFKKKRGVFLYMINRQFGMFCYKVESIDAHQMQLRDTHSGELFTYRRRDDSLAGKK